MTSSARSAMWSNAPRGRGLMLARAFFCQNVAIGCSFGGFSVSALPLQERFQSTRGVVSLGLALVVLAMGLAGPLVAAMLARLGLRKTMAIGVALSATGYLALAFAPNMTIALAAYAVLVGPGVAMFGPLPSSMLASNWFPHNQGKAVGVANVPLFVALVPLLAVAVIQRQGLSALLLWLAAMHLLLLPVVLGVSDRPLADETASPEPAAHIAKALRLFSARELLVRPMFWLLVLGGGALSAVGIIGVSQVVALAIEKGVSPASAALLVSVMGGASVVGSLLVGAICDRVGGAKGLAGAALGLTCSWIILLTTSALPPMMLAMMLAGATSAGVFPCVAVLSAHAFGPVNLPRALSLYGLFSLPLTFLLPPGAGLLRDLAGNYAPVILSISACCSVISLMFFFVGRSTPQAVSSADAR